MTEPFRPDDELVSAVLDGEATEAERARVAADPELSARLAEFEAVARRVGEPVTVPTKGERDRAVATAVAEGRRPDAVVRALSPPRVSRSFLASAAAVLLVLVAAGFLVTQVGGGGDDLADGGGDAAESAGDDAGGTAASEPELLEDADGATAFDEGLDTLDLGTVADAEALRRTIEAETGLTSEAGGRDTAPSPDATSRYQNGDDSLRGADEGCQVLLEEADPSLAGEVLRGTATYGGTPAVVRVFATAAGPLQVVVVTAEGCDVLATFTL